MTDGARRERLIADLSASIRGAGTIVRGMTEWLEAFQTITERVHRGTPISIAELELIAQWNGIAVGVLASRSAEVTRVPPTERHAHRSPGLDVVLRALEGLSNDLLRLWVTDDSLPECRLLAAAELFRRGLGASPFDAAGVRARGVADDDE